MNHKLTASGEQIDSITPKDLPNKNEIKKIFFCFYFPFLILDDILMLDVSFEL